MWDRSFGGKGLLFPARLCAPDDIMAAGGFRRRIAGGFRQE